MHPIEAKALGFINDDEFRSLMHGGETSGRTLEHAAVAAVAGGSTVKRTRVVKFETPIPNNVKSVVGKPKELAKGAAEQHFKNHPDVLRVIVRYEDKDLLGRLRINETTYEWQNGKVVEIRTATSVMK